MPAIISDLVVWRNSPYNLRGHNKVVVPRFSTYIMKILFVTEELYCGTVFQDFNNYCNFKQFYSEAKQENLICDKVGYFLLFYLFYQQVIG